MFFAIFAQGSAHNPHVLRVRSGCSALSVSKLAAAKTPDVPISNFQKIASPLYQRALHHDRHQGVLR
ncbi:hypothetical protein B2M27_06330 [Kluyvera intermedia]|uniref:L-asparaginase n=1 Tax=Kluyvera intermedia TaxID=61648 RepID=A0ABX3UI76_KLUIN|nr:hypothetical protein B2M27_06330 [Kluyvera intermedia]